MSLPSGWMREPMTTSAPVSRAASRRGASSMGVERSASETITTAAVSSVEPSSLTTTSEVKGCPASQGMTRSRERGRRAPSSKAVMASERGGDASASASVRVASIPGEGSMARLPGSGLALQHTQQLVVQSLRADQGERATPVGPGGPPDAVGPAEGEYGAQPGQLPRPRGPNGHPERAQVEGHLVHAAELQRGLEEGLQAGPIPALAVH